jgi:hypothetical protein
MERRMIIRATHHYGFRYGKWAEIIAVTPHKNRACYVVKFPDGVTDLWPVHDPSDPYEFNYA